MVNGEVSAASGVRTFRLQLKASALAGRDFEEECKGGDQPPPGAFSRVKLRECVLSSLLSDLLTYREGYSAMLVLSRKLNEKIVINNVVTVTVVEIRGDKVRLGIVAPKEVAVHRQEVYDAIHGKQPHTEEAATPLVVANKPLD